MGYFGYGPMYGGWGGFLFMLLGVLVMIAVIVGLIRLFSGPGPTQHRPPTHDAESHRKTRRSEVLHILEQRFARGEIDEEEFRQRRKALNEEH